jgi:proteic killer suppression protein
MTKSRLQIVPTALTSTVNSRIINEQVRIDFSPFALKQIIKIPADIKSRLNYWIQAVKRDGLIQTRRTPGYHDKPLSGSRAQQRSVRLNRSWRLFYRVSAEETLTVIFIEEVNKHDY